MGSPNINFKTIPASSRTPGMRIEYDTRSGINALPGLAYKMLIIGQMLATGQAPALTPMEVFSSSDAGTYFGLGSNAYIMARAALAANPYLQLTVIGVPDAGAGQQASGTITITVTGTPQAGALRVYIGGMDWVDVAISNADTATSIAASIVTAITANKDLPVSAAAAQGVATLTALNKGLWGNEITLGYTLTNASNVTCAIVPMAGGATNPTLTNALAAVFGAQYDVYVTPYNNSTDLPTVKAQIDAVSSAMEQRPGVGVFGCNGSLSAATTLASAINDYRMYCMYVRYITSQQKAMPCELAACYGAIMCAQTTPNLPLFSLFMTGLPVPAVADRFSGTEIESCLSNGTGLANVGPDGSLEIVRAVSTFITDSSGSSEPWMIDLGKIRALDYLRAALLMRMRAHYARALLTQKVLNSIKDDAIDVCLTLEPLGITQNTTDLAGQFVCEVDSQNVGQANLKVPADIVDGLQIIAGQIVLTNVTG